MIWLLFTVFLLSCHPSQAALFPPKARWVKVTASIGQNYATTIFGYGPPESRIELTSPSVFSATFSDTNGYFKFNQLVLPKNPQDLCLTALDENHRLTQPTCIAPPPSSDYSYWIGPILLPPTVSLDADQLQTNPTIVASGQSFPNSDILITFFQIDPNPPLLVIPAQALELPQLQLKSDPQGNFSFSLPTTYVTSYRFFASAVFQNQPSPRSNPLFYTLHPRATLTRFILIIFLVLIPLIFFLIWRYFPRRHVRHLPWLPPTQVTPRLLYSRSFPRRFFPWLPPHSAPRPRI